jgi:exopolysaccharide biosynthesis protein
LDFHIKKERVVMFKSKVVFIALLVSQASFALKINTQEIKELYADITYACYCTKEFPLNVHVITLPLDSIDIKLVHALGQREEVSRIAQASNALIAINGSNYRRGGKYNGNRVNLLYHDNNVYSDLQFVRGSFGWDSLTKRAKIDTTFLKIDLLINKKVYTVDAVNQPRIIGQTVLYTPQADRFLLYNTLGKNIIIANNSVHDITHNAPEITQDSYVLQVDPHALPEIQKGMPVTFNYGVLSADSGKNYNACDFVLGGAGLLIRNGKIQAEELFEEFSQGTEIVHCNDEVAADFHTPEMQHWLIDQRHPRTAIGTTHNQLYIVVVDGRSKDSEGLSLPELAEFMHELGCVDALNIGGGGCTTLCIKDTVINKPSASQERPVSEALCFYKI